MYQNCMDSANFLALCLEMTLSMDFRSALKERVVSNFSSPPFSRFMMYITDPAFLSRSLV